MLLNDLKKDFKQLLLNDGLTVKAAAAIAEKHPAYMSMFYKYNVVAPVFLDIYEKLGYNIKIEYIKRDSDW